MNVPKSIHRKNLPKCLEYCFSKYKLCPESQVFIGHASYWLVGTYYPSLPRTCEEVMK